MTSCPSSSHSASLERRRFAISRRTPPFLPFSFHYTMCWLRQATDLTHLARGGGAGVRRPFLLPFFFLSLFFSGPRPRSAQEEGHASPISGPSFFPFFLCGENNVPLSFFFPQNLTMSKLQRAVVPSPLFSPSPLPFFFFRCSRGRVREKPSRTLSPSSHWRNRLHAFTSCHFFSLFRSQDRDYWVLFSPPSCPFP